MKGNDLPERSLKWATITEGGLVAVVEVGEVGVDFENPIRLNQHDGTDVETASLAPQ